MPLSPELDKNIRKSFEELIDSGNCIIEDLVPKNQRFISDVHTADYTALKMQTSSIVRMVFGNTARGVELQSRIADLEWETHHVRILVGILTALQYDYVNGYNTDLEEAIIANVSRDYMSLAESLLGEGIPGQNDHVPAAVLCGAVLENRLSQFCEQQNPPIDTIKKDGSSKTLGPLIGELEQRKLFNKLAFKNLKAWADIRNSAAHGKFTDFTRHDVELMLAGVQHFLINHL